MKIERTREELENILLAINEIVKENEGKIDFDKIKEEFLSSNGSKFDMQITEEELEEIFRKYDLTLFKGEYQKFLNTSELSRRMYDDIRFIMYDEKTITVYVGKILKQKFIDEFKKCNQEASEEDINELYEKTLNEQYTRFQNVQIYGVTMLNYIKRLAVRDANGNLFRYGTKQKIKEEIQNKVSLEENKLSIGLKKMLECFDSVFDIIWYDYYSSDYTKKLIDTYEKSKPKDFISTVKDVIKKIPTEKLEEGLEKNREEQRKRKEREKDKETFKCITITKGKPDFKNQAVSMGEKRKNFSTLLKPEKEIKAIPVNREANNRKVNDSRENLKKDEEKEGEEI